MRRLKAEFDAADAVGTAALKKHDFKVLGEAIDREAAITKQEGRLISEYLAGQKKAGPKSSRSE